MRKLLHSFLVILLYIVSNVTVSDDCPSLHLVYFMVLVNSMYLSTQVLPIASTVIM